MCMAGIRGEKTQSTELNHIRHPRVLVIERLKHPTQASAQTPNKFPTTCRCCSLDQWEGIKKTPSDFACEVAVDVQLNRVRAGHLPQPDPES